jgi:peroxiredoxin
MRLTGVFLRKYSFLALVAASGAVSVACHSTAPATILIRQDERKLAPNLRLRDANGVEVLLTAYRGKVVALLVWRTTCQLCKPELSWFTVFDADYRDRGFAALGLSLDSGRWDLVRAFLNEHGMGPPIFMADSAHLLEAFGGIPELPTTFIIDREGYIAAIVQGSRPRRAYEEVILQLLKDRPPAS